MNKLLTLLFSCLSLSAFADSQKLMGTIIGTELSVDYSTNKSSTTVNTRDNAFDGKLDTYFASYDRSLTWVGLDLGTPHIIKKVAWSPRNDSQGARRVRLGVFEGANNEDFSDGVPLYLIPEDGQIGVMSSAAVEVTRPFRYVRYIGPNNARCNVAEVEFYGEECTEAPESEVLYQPTNLPAVVVHVADNKEPQDKVNDLVANFSIISKKGKKELYQPGTFRLRGNASMSFEKKPYRIKFEKKQNVLDAPAKAKKWTLVPSYGDKTLMRNIVGFELSRRFGQAYTPYIQPVDVFVNGEYKGCYQLCDQVEVGKGRVEIDEMTPEDISGENLTGGYFIEVDAYAYDEKSWFNSRNSNPVTIKSPDEDEIKLAQSTYIKAHFNKLENALFGNDFEDETKGYRQYLDLESFLNHFLIGELNGNTDTYWSLNMYKKRGDDKFYTGPIWDLDLAFENDNRTYPINNLSSWIYDTNGSVAGNFRKFVSRIVKEDKKAIEQMRQLWADARRNKKIYESSLLEFIDETAKTLNKSQDLNFKRWNIMYTLVHQNPNIWQGYENEVENIKNYLKQRLIKMDYWLKFDATSLDEISSDAAFGSIFEVYNLQGVKVADITSDEVLQQLSPATYILRDLEGNTKKVTIVH